MNSPVIEPGSPRWEADERSPEPWQSHRATPVCANVHLQFAHVCVIQSSENVTMRSMKTGTFLNSGCISKRVAGIL
jgi:hypothetical protein